VDTETRPLWTTEREAMGKTWTVELWAENYGMAKEGSDLGYSRDSEQVMRVNARMVQNTRDSILLHEMIEMVDTQQALKLEHDTIDRLQAGLFAFLRGFGLWRDFPWPDRSEVEDS
jgi:hypothetical protein